MFLYVHSSEDGIFIQNISFNQQTRKSKIIHSVRKSTVDLYFYRW